MRVKLRLLMMLVVLAISASTVQAQLLDLLPTLRLPFDVGIDSSGRVAYVFAHQALRYMDEERPPYDKWKTDFNPHTPVLSGVVEVSPASWFSGRLAGSFSVLAFEEGITRATGLPEATNLETYEWRSHPYYRDWEAAGLYHLYGGGGYRFSVTAGARHETWIFRGIMRDEDASMLRDELTTYFPFIGLQTSMYMPWWKARFEVIASPYARTQVIHQMRRGEFFLDHDGFGKKGGYLEFRAEGSMHVNSRMLLGVYAAYRYHELYGTVAVKSNAIGFDASSYDFYMEQSVMSIGLNATLVF